MRNTLSCIKEHLLSLYIVRINISVIHESVFLIIRDDV